jgi:MFS family permease
MSSLPKGIRNSLCKFSGEDFAVIRVCSTKIQLYFLVIGLFVLLILLCCFLSALYFTEHLFHNAIADIGVGIIWGYIVTNLYVLLLYTITPSLLPKKDRKKNDKTTKSFELNFSMALRIGLVILLAMITAQPLNIFLLKLDTQAFAFDIRNLLTHDFRAWIVTIFVVAIFLLPIYLKYSIRKLGEFYEKKAEIKKRIIEDDYKDFKKEYKQIIEDKISNYNKNVWENLMPFLTKLEQLNPIAYQKHFAEIKNELVNEKIEKYEYWANPPYRTEHKSHKRIILSEQDLLNQIYPETD